MSAKLQWRSAKFADRRSLQRFVCTDGDLVVERHVTGSVLQHPRIWEYQVQEIVRRLRVPLGKRYQVRIGEDGDGLAAVSMAEELERGALYELNCVAVATRLRGNGGAYADEMLRDTLDLLTARCVDLAATDVAVMCLIDPRNGPSQRLFDRHGFVHADDLDGLQVWRMALPLPGGDSPDC